MNTTGVSIIIPIYNAEKYLEQCIQNVLDQTYTNWELLLIDDGSTDRSLFICTEYKKKDYRIKVIHKSNTGVSDTRNQGIEIATEKYVMFLDADDFWCDSSFLEQFIQIAEKNDLDIVRGEYKAVDADGKELYLNVIDTKKIKVENTVLDSVIFLDNIIQREFFLPLCLFKRSIIKDLRFNTKRVFLEDIEFFLSILVKNVRCFYIPTRLYAYRKHKYSASNRFDKKRLSDAFDLCALYRDLSLTNIDVRLAQSFKKRSWDYYWLTLRTMATENHYFANSRKLCVELNVDDLRCTLQQFMSSIIADNKWIHKLSPFSAICYFRLRYLVGQIYRIIKSK